MYIIVRRRVEVSCFSTTEADAIKVLVAYSNFYEKTANINSKNLLVYKCCYWRESLA